MMLLLSLLNTEILLDLKEKELTEQNLQVFIILDFASKYVIFALWDAKYMLTSTLWKV